MKKNFFIVSCFLLLGCSYFLKAQAEASGYKIVNKFHIEGDGGWDYLNVEQTWSIEPGEEASGMALDNETHRLFAVCGNKLMVVLDALSGKVITTLPIGDGCDGATFDPELKRAYSSNGEGTMTVVQEISPDKFTVLENVPTLQGARTITLDKKTHHIFMSAAEYEAPNPSAGNTNRRPAVKPGTFMVLDVAPVK